MLQFEGGPLSRLLDTQPVVAAAEGYVRIRVRVPEAYLLLSALDATRPGLLVLDDAGRRGDCIPLPGMGAPDIGPDEVAKRLRAARDAPALERFRARVAGGDAAAFVAALGAREGVSSVRLEQGVLHGAAAAGKASPGSLVALARSHGVELTVEHPVPVRAETPPAAAWYAGDGEAWVPAHALDPAEASDLEAREFALPGVSKGGPGARVAAAPLAVPGVLAVFPDLFADAERVVARKGAVDWTAVEKAFADAGCEARPPPDPPLSKGG